MSTWVDRQRRRFAAHAGADDGFTLLEVIVALILLGLIAAALTPVMISAARASIVAKRATVAKNLTQQRVDQMRNLTFHVDAQNGPFLDLLDDYYPNVSTSATAVPGSGTGYWCSAQTSSGNCAVPGGPLSGAFYHTSFQNAFSVNGFSQDVYAQFLNSAQPLSSPVPASSFTTYNSATTGQDQPPSLLLGVTVVTSWGGVGGTSKIYRTSTEITNTAGGGALILSQSHATGLWVKSATWDGQLIDATIGDVKADGGMANSSSASAFAEGAHINIGSTDITGATSTAVAPPGTSSGSSSPVTTSGQQLSGSGNCGGGSFGPTQLVDATSYINNSLPLAPSDAGSGGNVEADLGATGGGGCNGFWFTNQTNGAPSTDPRLQLNPDSPMVRINDTGGSGNLESSKVAVSASNAIGTAGAVSATASVAYPSSGSFAARVSLFPGLQFMSNYAGQSVCGSTGTSPCGSGLVNVFLSSASLSCQSMSSPTASYSGYLTYWTQTGWHSVALSWSSSTTSSDPLASIDRTQQVATYNGNPVRLGDYVSNWSSARGLTNDPTSGDTELTTGSVVSITTAPTRLQSDGITGDSASSIGFGLGRLACVASDNR